MVVEVDITLNISLHENDVAGRDVFSLQRWHFALLSVLFPSVVDRLEYGVLQEICLAEQGCETHRLTTPIAALTITPALEMSDFIALTERKREE